MGRLIDADALLEALEEIKPHGNSEEVRIMSLEFADCLNTVMQQPTAYDVDKVVKELDRLRVAEYDYESEEEPEDFDEMLADAESSGKIKAYLKAADIVRKGGAE